MGMKRNIYTVLLEKPQGKRQLGRPSRRRENSIKMNPESRGMAGCALDWPDLRSERVLGSCECGNERLGSTKSEEFLE